ncbi:kinesin-like protein KIF20B, partial [Bombina bombina]|uniref:kinesin-like protein KIF20B n=1 Tax=Bombina bombina TaxID=8345 RepID=UPI00235A88C6
PKFNSEFNMCVRATPTTVRLSILGRRKLSRAGFEAQLLASQNHKWYLTASWLEQDFKQGRTLIEARTLNVSLAGDGYTITKTSCNEDHASIPPETLLTSVKSDLAVIKKQAVQAYFHIASIPDPPEAISELEKRLSLAEAELSNTQDELKKRTMELNCQIDKCSKTTSRLDEAEKKLLTQKDEIIDLTKIIQEKDSAIEKLKAHVAHWEAKFEEYDKTMNNIKGEMKKMSKNDTESIGRKRPLDEHSGPSDQPPSKKELVENITTNFPAAQKQINVPDLCESSMQEIENEKCETEKYKEQMKNFKQNIALLEEKLSRSVDQVMQMESKNETLVSELQMSKNLNLSLEETVKALTNEVDRNKQNIAGKVAQIRTIQVKLDEFVNSGIKDTADLANFNFIDLIEESKNVNQSSAVTESQTRMENSGRESTFYCAIDGLWKECQRVLQESTKKNQLIKELKEQLDNLNNEISLLKNENIELQHNFITVTAKDELLAQLRNQLSEGTNALECKEKCILESKKEIIVLRNQIDGNKEKITELESLLDSQNDTQVKMGSLEMQNKEKATAVMTLENRLEEVEMKRTDCENKLNTLNDYKVNLEQEIVNLQNKCTTFENTCQEKEKQVEDATQEIKQLKKDLSQQAKEFQNLRLDLQRKEEDYTDLKDKLNDAKKQIHQVEKEVSSMREEKKLLTNKLCEYEKLKNQMSGELEMKQRTIQQLKKDPFDNEKNREAMRLYQIACE